MNKTAPREWIFDLRAYAPNTPHWRRRAARRKKARIRAIIVNEGVEDWYEAEKIDQERSNAVWAKEEKRRMGAAPPPSSGVKRF